MGSIPDSVVRRPEITCESGRPAQHQRAARQPASSPKEDSIAPTYELEIEQACRSNKCTEDHHHFHADGINGDTASRFREPATHQASNCSNDASLDVTADQSQENPGNREHDHASEHAGSKFDEPSGP